MEGIIDKENERVRGFFALLDNMEKKVERLARDNRPPFNGERFLTDRELSGMLKISRRCLQDYRDYRSSAMHLSAGFLLSISRSMSEDIFRSVTWA